MAEKNEIQEEEFEEETKTLQPKKISKGWIAISLLLLVIGFLAGNFLKPITGLSTIASDIDTGIGQNTSEVDKTKLMNTIETYLNDNFLSAQGATGKVTSLKELGDSLFEVEIDIFEGEKKITTETIYATRDGQNLVLGNVLNLSEQLPTANVSEAKNNKQTYAKSDKPNVKIFVMSFCPYGQQAEAGLLPVVELLGDKIEFEPHYVIYDSSIGYQGENYCFDADNQYCSMHGVNELREDVRQLVIWNHFRDKFIDYVKKINSTCSSKDVETCWKGVAEAVGLNVEEIESFFEAEALDLLATEKTLNQQYNVRGSPTIFINDDEYVGGRSSEAFKSGICSAFNTEPDECSQSLNNTAGNVSGSCN